jgi:hypothetical protein
LISLEGPLFFPTPGELFLGGFHAFLHTWAEIPGDSFYNTFENVPYTKWNVMEAPLPQVEQKRHPADSSCEYMTDGMKTGLNKGAEHAKSREASLSGLQDLSDWGKKCTIRSKQWSKMVFSQSTENILCFFLEQLFKVL